MTLVRKETKPWHITTSDSYHERWRRTGRAARTRTQRRRPRHIAASRQPRRRTNAPRASHVSGRRSPGFTRRSRSKDHAVGGATAASSESDLSGIPLDNMDFDISPSSSCFDAAGLHQGPPPSWVGSSSSTDSGETFQGEFQDGYRVKRSRLYPNSEVIEQHCLKPSVARALFHQMEAASCRGGKGTKYSWQVKKGKQRVTAFHGTATLQTIPLVGIILILIEYQIELINSWM